MNTFAALDPTLPPLIAAVATLAVALGLNEKRRRRQTRKDSSTELDRQAAETILTQWKAVLEASQDRAEWERDERRRCEERNKALNDRLDHLEEQLRTLKWEIARRDWIDTQRKKRKRDAVRRDTSDSRS